MKKQFVAKRAKVALAMSLVMLISGISGLFVALTQLGFLGAKGSIDFVTNNVSATVSEATISGGKFSSGETLPELVFNAEESEDETVVSEDSDITEGKTTLPNSDQNTNSLTNEQKESSGIVSWDNIDIEFDEGSTEASIAFAITNTGTEQLAVALQNVSGTFTNVTYKIKINGKEVDETVINPEGIVTHNITAEIVITFTVTVPNGNALVRNFSIPFEFKTTSVRTEVSDQTTPIFPYIPEDSESGFTYEFTADGEGVYFGEWPQTIAAPGITFASIPDEDGYYLGSDGQRYAKVTTDFSDYFGVYNISDWDYFYSLDLTKTSNGTTMLTGETYYFKVEPILWEIISVDPVTNVAKLMCTSILSQQTYQENYASFSGGECYITDENDQPILVDGDKVSANNYKLSQLRQWLINDFYNAAFNSAQQDLILSTYVDNSTATTQSTANKYVCENTVDKVYVMSFNEIQDYAKNYLSTSDNYLFPTTDYSKAMGAITHTRKYMELEKGKTEEDLSSYSEKYFTSGIYWLRSPCTYSYGSQAVQHKISGYFVDKANIGVIPTLKIQFNGPHKVISFSVDGTTYKATEGMTWEQWLESDYNSNGYFTEEVVSGNCLYTPVVKSINGDLYYVVVQNETIEDINNVITANKQYVINSIQKTDINTLPVWNGTDLTGTTWYVPAGWKSTSSYSFNILATASFASLRITRLIISSHSVISYSDDEYGLTSEIGAFSENPFTITIDGGTDATNENLITWLKTNGKLISHLSPRISFTIDGITYQAKEKMTWAEWCSSEFNTNKEFFVSGDAVYVNDPNSFLPKGTIPNVLANEVIQVGFSYTTQSMY